MVVSAWAVHDLPNMVLPPCHYGFQVYTRELSLKERIEMIQPFGMDALIPEAREKWMEENNIPKRAISLMWNQRSVDTFLGLPFNIASYGLLLLMLAKRVNMVPDELIGNLGDTHLYSNHLEQAKEQIGRESFKLPQVELDFEYTYFDGYITEFDKISRDSIKLVNYKSHTEIKAPLSN
jgi:thymidylate synthase